MRPSLCAAALATTLGLVGLGAATPAPQPAPTVSVIAPTRSTSRSAPPVPPRPARCVFDLYRPSTATKAHREPAILTTNGFGGSKDDQADLAKAFARRGYVVLSYSGLGFGGSGCKITLDDPDWDGKAAQQLVTFLGGGSRGHRRHPRRLRPPRRARRTTAGTASTTRGVGMVGGSYGGQVQFAVAGIDPRVDTIVPIITWNDLSYSLAPNNTSFTTADGHGVRYGTPGTEKIGWTSLFFGVGIADGIQYASTDPSRNVGCPNFADQACVAKAQMDALGYPTRTRWTSRGTRASSSYIVEDPDPDPARPGRERHAVRPAGGGRPPTARCGGRARR